MLEPLSCWIAYQIGYFDDHDLVSWAVDYAQNAPSYSDSRDLVELMSLNPKRRESVEKAGPLMARFVESMWPSFDLQSPGAVAQAQEWLSKRLKQYIDGQCEPWDLCRMVPALEHVFDFPPWIGDLYDACDWVEPGRNRAYCPDLECEARAVLAALPANDHKAQF